LGEDTEAGPMNYIFNRVDIAILAASPCSMSFFDYIDRDKLLNQVFRNLFGALEAWRHSAPTGETEAMSHIISAFNKRKTRNCDIGVSGEVKVESRFAPLHRRGGDSSDKFGSDLALTVTTDLGGSPFSKTAFLQLKIASDRRAEIRRDQLEDASAHSEVESRAFAIALDPRSGCVCVQAVAALLKDFPKSQKTHQVDTSTWQPFYQWLINWLECREGRPTDPNKPELDPFNGLIKRFLLREPPSEEEDERTPVPSQLRTPDIPPARSSLTLAIKKAN
jgi:hypothetical protein